MPVDLTNYSVFLYSSDPTVFNDATQYVSSISIVRGKSRALDYYEPGSLSITFNNYNRLFDPTNISSTFYGYIQPKRRIIVQLPGGQGFSGLIDDWSFTYDNNGESYASLTATEKISFFVNQYLDAQTFPSELSGARVTRILNDPNVQWPTGWGSQVISPGTQKLDADTIAAGTNVLDYLRQIETSEQGQLFMQGTDSLKFQDNNYGISNLSSLPVFSDNGTGWSYESIEVSYTSQLLYNKIQATSWDSNTATTVDSDSISSFGVYQLNIENILYGDTTKLRSLSNYLANKYSEPEYRFDSIKVNVYGLSSSQQINLGYAFILNGFASVICKPNGIGSAIQKYVRIIGIEDDVTPSSHYRTYKLESIKNPSLVLDDVEFGKLDTYSLGL